MGDLKMNALNLSDQELDQHIYRIMRLNHLYDLFETGENVLVRPRLWGDPFENFILRSRAVMNGEIIQWGIADDFYGQCWTRHNASDAMWQIYSPKDTKDGIRVRTTIRKVLTLLARHAGAAAAHQAFVGRVEYLPNTRLMAFANSVISIPLNPVDFARTLLVKRPAFKHEREIRLLFLADRKAANSDVLRYPFDPHNTVEQLMLDPRLTAVEAQALKTAIIGKTQFRGPVLRSLLYTLPQGLRFTIE